MFSFYGPLVVGSSPGDSINSTDIVIFYYLEISTKMVLWHTNGSILQIPLLLIGLASSYKANKWPIAKRRSPLDMAAGDSG